ncbi:hypothetical protein RhiirC2_844605 [Rhizophagus irregularis]|uniref:Uncharacterized protein n=1 Tax=Rhizophagus irregularis TaxID=588596 RepID=A0A2N1NT97_9GLOM|nr:hypothetical protein RhiirC2_844605 [Rhizophagus irregularis]
MLVNEMFTNVFIFAICRVALWVFPDMEFFRQYCNTLDRCKFVDDQFLRTLGNNPFLFLGFGGTFQSEGLVPFLGLMILWMFFLGFPGFLMNHYNYYNNYYIII